MAVDKLVDSTQLDSDLTSVANAIRAKGGTSASLAFPAEFITAINAITEDIFQEVAYLTIGSSGPNYFSIPYTPELGDVIEYNVSAVDWSAFTSMASLAIKTVWSGGDTSRGNFTVQTENGNRVKALYAAGNTILTDYYDSSIVASGGATVRYGDPISNNDIVNYKVINGATLSSRYLFYGGYSNGEYMKNANLYTLTVKDSSDNLKLKLIPSYLKRSSPIIIGLYDSVSGAFYTPTAGTVAQGPDIT